MTRPAVLALLLLAAAPLAAQKPDAENMTVARWREQGVALCVAELGPLEGLTPDATEAICGCTFSRLPRFGATDRLAPLGPGPALRAAVGGEIVACAIERDPERASVVARWLAGAGTGPPTVVTPPLPPAVNPPKPLAPEADLESWWNNLAWPDWLSRLALPRWSWGFLALLALLGLALRRGLFRRDSASDLTGPPAHMRPRGPKS